MRGVCSSLCCVWIGSYSSRMRKQAKQELEEAAAREAARQDLEGEASPEEIEVRVLVLFLCCCVAEGIIA